MSALSSDPTSEFSVKRLARELATATADEEQRKLIDDTKKKAIVVAHSYEDFKNRVACANMKPLKSKELKELGNHQTHNRAFGFNSTHSSEAMVLRIYLIERLGRVESLPHKKSLGSNSLNILKVNRFRAIYLN